MLSHSVVEDAVHMNSQARMCACQLRLHIFPGCESLSQVIHRNGVKWWPYTQAILISSVPKPSAAQVLVAYGSPSHPPGPVAETRIRLGRRLQCVPSWVLGSAVGCWVAEWCRCRASREGLDHTTIVKYVASLPT